METKRKHVLEYFQKDPWQVRVFILAMHLIFLLAVLVAMLFRLGTNLPGLLLLMGAFFKKDLAVLNRAGPLVDTRAR